MKAFLFGSIGTIADTSELQRDAYNKAFKQHGLDWHWDRDVYRGLLRQAGGRRRIELQSQMSEEPVDARAIHATKSDIFQQMLSRQRAVIRPGVQVLIAHAKAEGIRLGLVTTTGRANVMRLLDGVDLPRTTFEVITTTDEVSRTKPAPDCYHYALACLAVEPADCLAVEDNSDGARAARDATIPCLAWPGANTADHDFPGAIPVQGALMDAIWERRGAAA